MSLVTSTTVGPVCVFVVTFAVFENDEVAPDRTAARR